ncbi:unnamed protein product [Heterosigma akashiwo]
MEVVRQLQGEEGGIDAIGGKQTDASEMDEEAMMRQIMGFGGFDTTQGKVVSTNHKGAAKGAIAKHKKREYRQYMNRRGGFNRPLDVMKS